MDNDIVISSTEVAREKSKFIIVKAVVCHGVSIIYLCTDHITVDSLHYSKL